MIPWFQGEDVESCWCSHCSKRDALKLWPLFYAGRVRCHRLLPTMAMLLVHSSLDSVPNAALTVLWRLFSLQLATQMESHSLSLSLVAVCAPSSPSYRASCVWFIQHGANINSATNHLSKEELAAEDLFSANFLQFSHQHAPDSAATVKRGFTLARSFSILTH